MRHITTTLAPILSGLLVAFSLNAAPAVAEVAANLIKVDGSSTVYPITEAVAEEFGASDRAIRLTVGISGTGGGFKKFCAGETDISDASRPIRETEVQLCAKNGIDYIELPIAYDALSVVINPKNTWATQITVAELKKIWEPEAQNKITRWNQVRADWPDKPLVLFGPGTDSGTYDYFTEAIMGKEDASRADFTSSEDDNILVQGIAGDEGALGYFGMADLIENQDKLKAAKIDSGNGAVAPTPESVKNGTYKPLSRPLFNYVNKRSAERAEVRKFVNFYLAQSPVMLSQIGYVALPSQAYALATQRFTSGRIGSMFAGQGSQVALTIEELLKKEL